MTSIAEPRRESRPVAWVRIAILFLLLTLGALGSFGSWSVMWLLVPAVTAAALLLAWRFGTPALVLPALLAVGAVGVSFAGLRGFALWHTAWLPLGAAVGVWMGLHEEGGGPGAGERAWMYVPLLVVAALLPVTPGFSPAVERYDRGVRTQLEAYLRQPEAASLPAPWREGMQKMLQEPQDGRLRELLLLVPNLLFLWSALLVTAGRALAARSATLLGWPALSRAPLRRWRLPDVALLPLLAGLALVVFGGREWQPVAQTLLAYSALGYSVQGIAVVESVLRGRGMPPAFVTLTLVFVIAASLLLALPVIAVVGLSDVWLDYRRLEPSPEGEA